MTQTWRSRSLVPHALSVFLAAAGTLVPAVMPAQASDMFQSLEDPVSPLFDKAKGAVVKVESGDQGMLLAGTGFFIDNQGTVLTSSTVIGDNTSVRVTVNGIGLDAKILGNDPRSGLAMLKVNYDDSPFLPLGRSIDLKTGDSVLAVGYPLNLPVSSSQGPVSGFSVHYLARFFATTHIHANVPISPGEVGSPLLNGAGEVVGLVVPSPDDGRSIYALPVEAMEKIMGDFAQYGHARHGWAGVLVIQVPDMEQDGRTVQVAELVPGTPASKSGILAGDTVMRINSTEIYRPADVLDASFFSHVGGAMNVLVRRQDKLLNYTFAVMERPQNPAVIVPATADNSGHPSNHVMAKSP